MQSCIIIEFHGALFKWIIVFAVYLLTSASEIRYFDKSSILCMVTYFWTFFEIVYLVTYYDLIVIIMIIIRVMYVMLVLLLWYC